MLISIKDYAALHGRATISVQQKARRGGFKTAVKKGRDWFIDSDEPYIDNRHGPETSLGTRTCRQCGKEFTGGPRAWYCPECREKRKRQQKSKDNYKQRLGLTRKLGSTDYCTRCGKPYTVTGGLQKYCPDCADEAMRENDRNQARQYYEDNKEQTNPVRNNKRRVKTKQCVICGKEFDANGTARNTCSEECRKKQRQTWQRAADKKRKK